MISLSLLLLCVSGTAGLQTAVPDGPSVFPSEGYPVGRVVSHPSAASQPTARA